MWRLLRRLGVRPDAAVDDAVQRVFEIIARKADRVPEGLERAFLFKTAVLVAAEERRRQQRTRERATEQEPLELASSEPDPEAALDERRNRELLDEILESMPEKFRTVFVLFELEGLTCAQIGRLLGVPEGTATSRLRIGRRHFQEAARRVRARLSWRTR
jgi:RNA polymerase sigma-70 factor (ECF subfamily)